MKRTHADAIERHGPYTYADTVAPTLSAAMQAKIIALRGPTSGPAELLAEHTRLPNRYGGTAHRVRVSAWGYGAPLAARHLRALSADLDKLLGTPGGARVNVYVAMTMATAARTHIGALVAEMTWDSSEAPPLDGPDELFGTPKRQRAADDGDGDGDTQSFARRVVSIVTGL